jgi:hypothetical protein
MIAENPREIQRWHQYIYVAYFLSSVTLSSLPCWRLSGNITHFKKQCHFICCMMCLHSSLHRQSLYAHHLLDKGIHQFLGLRTWNSSSFALNTVVYWAVPLASHAGGLWFSLSPETSRSDKLDLKFSQW